MFENVSNDSPGETLAYKPDSQTFDYFSNCVHCGLCLPQCPTYSELGDENDSPRGRIHLLQALAQERLQPSRTTQRHLDLCLDCRACETACPSGVQYGALLESYRLGVDGRKLRKRGVIDRAVEWLVLHVLPNHRRTRRLLGLTRLVEAMGFFDFLESAGLAKAHRANLQFPKVLARLSAVDRSLPVTARPAVGRPRARVALFLGCVSESILGRTNRATQRVLLHNRCEVHCPSTQQCCGAIHYHAGDGRHARQVARANIDAFEVAEGHIEAIVVNVAGCGLMLKGYASLLRDDADYAACAELFAGKVVDVNEFLAGLPLIPPTGRINAQVTYHEACHLCHGQQIREQPRQILRSIPGLELVEMPQADWCCGAAGTYSLTQPEMASTLAGRKLRHIDDSGASVVAVANAGCILHLMQHAAQSERSLSFVHPVDLLDQAYSTSPAEYCSAGQLA